MTESDDHRRDVAGRFIQATQIHIHNLIFRWFPPEVASHMIDVVMKEVEDEGLQVEGIKVICGWFRSEEDVAWLEQFWQDPEGGRFLALSAELMLRANLRRHAPDVSIPPPPEC